LKAVAATAAAAGAAQTLQGEKDIGGAIAK
jgi:hypothetical protein